MKQAQANDPMRDAPVARNPELSVVILTKNERENVRLLVPRLWTVTQRLGISAEIVVVDESTDDTYEVARRLGCRVLRQEGAGYAAALEQGLTAAAGEYVATIDADYSHEPEFLYQMWAAKNSADVVIGSRYVRGGRAEMPQVRRLLSRALNYASAALFALPYKDLSSGFRLYHRRVLRSPHRLASRDFDAQEELLVRAYSEGWRIREVPIRYRPRHTGRSNARAVRFAVSYARTFRALRVLRNSASSCDYDSRAFDSWILPQRWWQRRRFRLITDLARGTPRALDVGCGSSQIIQALPATIGLDANLRKLRFLRRKDPNRSLVCASVFALPFRTDALGAVICSEVIEHVAKSPSPLAELNRVLAPGGTLILGTPDYSSRRWRVIEWCYGKLLPTGYEEEHISHYTRQELLDLLGSSGFRIRSEHTIAASELILSAEKVRDAWRAQPVPS